MDILKVKTYVLLQVFVYTNYLLPLIYLCLSKCYICLNYVIFRPFLMIFLLKRVRALDWVQWLHQTTVYNGPRKCSIFIVLGQTKAPIVGSEYPKISDIWCHWRGIFVFLENIFSEVSINHSFHLVFT